MQFSFAEKIAKRFGYTKANTQSVQGYREESRAAGADYFGYYDDTEAPENDDDYLQAFNAHAILFAAINVKAQNSARPPIKIYKKLASGGREEITTG
jgi:hypothetical protein